MTFYSIADEAAKIRDAAQAIELATKQAKELFDAGKMPTTADYRLMAASNALDEAQEILARVIKLRRIGERVAA